MKVDIKKDENLLKDLGVHFLNENNFSKNLDVISTGSCLLNNVLGVGGWPVGKIIEIFGADSSGKTTLALNTVAEAQKNGKKVVYFDLENTLNIEWAKKIGVKVNELLVSRPENGEKTFEIINKIVSLNCLDLIIVDSVASLVPSYELEGALTDQNMGLHARLMSKGLRIMQSLMINSKTTIIFINQIREKIGNSYLPLTTTTGGRALKYAACMRVEVKRCDSIKDSSSEIIGFETRCMVVKNKYGAPLNYAKTAIYFDSGFDIYFEVINTLISKKILIKKGTWIEFEGKNISQGINQLRNKLKTDLKTFEKFKNLAFGN